MESSYYWVACGHVVRTHLARITHEKVLQLVFFWTRLSFVRFDTVLQHEIELMDLPVEF